jgi:hypothetical protein
VNTLIVLTCPRDDDEPFAYLAALSRQLEAEDVTFEVLVDISDVELERRAALSPRNLLPATTGLRHFERAPTVAGALKGNKLAYWGAVELGHHFGGDVVILEDDIALCGNAARRMLTFPVPPDLALVQFFSPDFLPAARSFPGLWRPPAADFTFTQAVKFPRRTIEKLVAWKDDPRFLQFASSDQAVALWLRTSGLRFGVHAPELVQHVGEISAIQEQSLSWRIAKTWPGFDFDAMRLYARDELYR